MDIIVDTNIIREDFTLAGDEWARVWEYLASKGGQLLVPEVVRVEADARFDSYCIELLNSIDKSIRKLGREVGQPLSIMYQLPRMTSELMEAEIGRESIVLAAQEEYKRRWLVRENEGRVRALEFTEEDREEVLREINYRHSRRLKPTEAQDVQVWLSVKKYLEKNTTDLVFVSNDKEAFGDAATGLLISLQSEIDASRVKYFNKLDHFLSKHCFKSKA